MEITATLPSAFAGVQRASQRLSQDAESLAAGNLDPAVVLDVQAAEIQFAASAKIMKAETEAQRRLIDMLA